MNNINTRKQTVPWIKILVAYITICPQMSYENFTRTKIVIFVLSFPSIL